jgi:hypothetical protein
MAHAVPSERGTLPGAVGGVGEPLKAADSGVADTTPVQAPPAHGFRDVDPAGRGGGELKSYRASAGVSPATKRQKSRETSAGSALYHEPTAEQLFFAATSPN